MKERHLALLVVLCTFLAAAQPLPVLEESGTRYYALQELLLRLGYSVGSGPDSITIRASEGILTLFSGSPDALWQGARAGTPEELSFRAPMRVIQDLWYVPDDVLLLLGIELDGNDLVLPGGERVPVQLPVASPRPPGDRYQLVDLGNQVPALRFFEEGEAGPETVSLLLADLGLLSLAFPEQQPELDAFVGELGAEKALLLLVTSLAPGTWAATLTFRQGSERIEVDYPFRLRLLRGEAGRVSPAEPVAALILLPERFNLRQPLSVTWSGITAEITFRR